MQQKITALAKDVSLLVLTAQTQLQRSNDQAYPFVQDAHFFYWTHISAPDWRLVIDTVNNQQWLIAPTVEAQHELFDGSLSLEDARRLSGIETVLTLAEGKALLHDLAKKFQTVHSLGDHPQAHHFNFVENPARQQLWRELSEIFQQVEDARPALSRIRAIKTADEIAHLRAAATLSVQGFLEVRDRLATVSHEYEIEAILSSAFRRTGAEGHAYDPIVAGGIHACTLHYAQNNDALPKSGFVLIDAAASVAGYAADITRTYAVGQLTKRQQAVHAAVETAHREIIALIRPGLRLADYQKQVDVIMQHALHSLGLYKTQADYRRYFPHAISHGLGLDVHDSLGGYDRLLPGMVLTVEPGIYIPEESIGVRLEDDILVTADGHDNLTAALPTSM